MVSTIELKNNADARCNTIALELHLLQQSSTALQSQHIELQQRYQDMLDSHTANNNNNSNNSITAAANATSPSRSSALMLQQELGEAYSCVDEATQAMTVLQGSQAQLTEALRLAEVENNALLLRLQLRDEEMAAERGHRSALEQQLQQLQQLQQQQQQQQVTLALNQESISVPSSVTAKDPVMLATTTLGDESTMLPNAPACIDANDVNALQLTNNPVKSDRPQSNSPVKSDPAQSNSTTETMALLVSSQAAEITTLNRQINELTEALGIARQQHQHQQQQQQQQQAQLQQQGLQDQQGQEHHYQQQQRQQEQQQQQQQQQHEQQQQQQRRIQELENALSADANRALLTEQVIITTSI